MKVGYFAWGALIVAGVVFAVISSSSTELIIGGVMVIAGIIGIISLQKRDKKP